MKQKLETLQTRVEELTSTNILDFYAGWWVLQQPTQPQGNIRESLKEDVRVRWNKVKKEVQGDLLAEGMLAIVIESRHISGGSDASSITLDQILDLLEINGIEWVANTERLDRNPHVDLFIHTWSKYVRREFFEDKNLFTKTWPEIKDDFQQSINKGTTRFEIPSVISLIEFCRDMFSDLRWLTDFGGEPWANIAENILKLWREYPNAGFEFIDHIIDLAHNNNTWINKFEAGNSLLDALDKKFNARTPKEYVGELSDRKIIAGVKRA